MLRSRIDVLFITFVLVIANPFSSGINRCVSARQDVDEQNPDDGTPYVQKTPEDSLVMIDSAEISLKSPVVDNFVPAVSDPDPDSLDQQDPILLADTNGIDDCATEDRNDDRDANIRKRSLSVSSQDRGFCSTNRKPPANIVPGFPGPNFYPKRKPGKFKLKKPNSNPCDKIVHSSELEKELIHVSCGYAIVGQFRSNPDFVLNCMPGELPWRIVALAL